MSFGRGNDRSTELGLVCLDSGRLEVQQYDADGAVCHRTVHPAADLLAVNGTVAEAVRQAVASPGTVCQVEVTRKPRKRKAHKRRENTDQRVLTWQSAGWTE